MAYNKTKWEDGMIIEANALNNIENGIETLGNADAELSNRIAKYEDAITIEDSMIGDKSGISLGLDAIKPIDSPIDLGTEENKFKDLYLEGIVSAEGPINAKGGIIPTGGITFNNNELTLTEKGDCSLDFRDMTGNSFLEVGKDTVEDFDVTFKTTDGNIYFTPTKLNGYSSTNFGNPDIGIEVHTGTQTWRISPFGDSTIHLGRNTVYGRWAQCYLKAAANVSSDRNLKENIVYLDDKEATTRQSVLTTDEMYNFVKNELKLTKYNYINKDSKSQDDHKDIIGFIAQDIATNEKVGNVLLTQDEEGVYGYDTGTYTNILAGALQKALNKIDDLEARIVELENK